MKKNIVLVVILALLFNACKSILVEDLYVKSNTPKIDISLNPEVDEWALGSSFWGITGGSNMFTGTSLYLDQRMLDTKTIFERTNTAWFSNQNESQGNITLKIPFSVIDYGKGFGYIFLNVFTACIPALCGVPIAVSRAKMEIEVTIKNKNGKIVAQYTAQGKGETKRAFYNGYSRTNASRKINIQALNQALQKIALQIHQDSAKIVAGLK